ncbi:MAG TPA: PD-(D/E)XK nuclease family protein, partial [Steroidobacteraceae bacterium]|nr:PD-(D/E)XK nuclease family protein [Steroidobacteraceae bacterium]
MFDATKFIQEYKAPSIDDEVRETARRIKELIGSSDTAPDYVSIAVASTDQESYAPVVRSIFSEYGIPFQLTQRTALSATPIFQAFEYLLELGLYRLSRRRVRSVLQSPYFSLAVADPQTLITVLHREHLPQGAADWHSDLRELAEDLDTQLSLEFEDELERRKIERSRDELLGAARDILAIEQLIERLQLGRTPKEFVQQINDLLKELGMLEHILSEANAMLRSGELETETRSYTALMNMLDELLTITDTLGLAQKKLGIGFYLERIRTVATRTRVAGRAEPGSSVLVTSLDQLFGNEYEHLFLLGFRDGLFPLAYRKSLFTPTEHSKTHDAHLIEQRYFFYQTLCTLRGKLFIGWHNGASDGSRIYNRSTALDALRRTVSLSEAKTDERSLFSPNEFYKASAQKINWSSVSEVSSLTEKGESAGMNADTLVRLKNVQPSLIEMEHTRRDKSESVYSGVMQPDELSDEERRWLDAYRDNVYSITQLETYAACGFKYFCKYVLGINANEGEAEDGLDASEQGSILHNALYKLLERFKERGLDIRSMGDSALLASREIMSEIYPESELARMHPFARLDRTRLLES